MHFHAFWIIGQHPRLRPERLCWSWSNILDALCLPPTLTRRRRSWICRSAPPFWLERAFAIGKPHSQQPPPILRREGERYEEDELWDGLCADSDARGGPVHAVPPLPVLYISRSQHQRSSLLPSPTPLPQASSFTSTSHAILPYTPSPIGWLVFPLLPRHFCHSTSHSFAFSGGSISIGVIAALSSRLIVGAVLIVMMSRCEQMRRRRRGMRPTQDTQHSVLASG
jgi:hypothetical protein